MYSYLLLGLLPAALCCEIVKPLLINDMKMHYLTHLSWSGPGEITLIQGEENSYMLEGSDEALSQLHVKAEEGTLRFIHEARCLEEIYKEPISCRVTVRDLQKITLDKNPVLTAEGLKVKDLALELSGTPRVKISSLSGQQFRLESKGDGNVTISGKVESQEIEMHGHILYQGEQLVSENCAIWAYGSGEITVNVHKELSYYSVGKVDLFYLGNPMKVSRKGIGSGTLKPGL